MADANVADVLTVALGGIDRGATGRVGDLPAMNMIPKPADTLAPTAVSGADKISAAIQSLPTEVAAQGTFPSVFDQSTAQNIFPSYAEFNKGTNLDRGLGSEYLSPINDIAPHQVDGAKKDFSLTSGQMAGLAAVSAGAQTYAALRNISQQEQAAMNNLNQQWKGFEFTNRANRSMEMLNEAREIFKTIDSMQTQGEQIAAGSQQQTFFRDPITGLRV